MLEPRLAAANPRIAATPDRSDKPTDPFYLSHEWRRLMRRLIALRGKRCERCGCWPSRVFGDHKIELKDGGALLDETNVELLCGSCHSRKTASARAARQARPAAKGGPSSAPRAGGFDSSI